MNRCGCRIRASNQLSRVKSPTDTTLSITTPTTAQVLKQISATSAISHSLGAVMLEWSLME